MQRAVWIGSQLLGNLCQTRPYRLMQSVNLGQDQRRVLPVIGQALHHRTEECLGEACRDIEGFLDCQFAGLFRSLHDIPAFLEEMNTHDYQLRGINAGGET
jgi:hypothetical protein